MVTDPHWQHWLVERLPAERFELVKSLYHEDLSGWTAAALSWYLRQCYFYDYKLDAIPNRLRLFKYEHLVSRPADFFAQMFDFLDLRYEPDQSDRVHSASVRRSKPPVVDAPAVL